MGWTPPSTVTPGEVAGSADWNLEVRDNLNFLHGPPRFRVSRSTDFSHTSSGSLMPVTFNAERYDTDSMHSLVTNTSRVTMTTAGVYLLGGHIEFAVSATGVRFIQFIVNGTTTIARSTAIAGSATDRAVCNLVTEWTFNAGDYVELNAFQSSGGTLAIEADDSYTPEFWGSWKGAA